MREFARLRLMGHCAAEAARELDISPTTAYRYENDSDWSFILDSVTREIFRDIAKQVIPAAKHAWETLLRNLKCGDPKAEVAAAKAVFSELPKWARIVGYDLEKSGDEAGRPARIDFGEVSDDELVASTNDVLLSG